MLDVTNPKSVVEDKLTDQSKTISLFQFIRELNKLKQKAILNTKDYPWTFALSYLPNDPDNIKMCYRDRVEDEPEADVGGRDNTLLSVHKPEFQKCPEPDAIFKNWLLSGWDSYRNSAGVKEFIELEPRKEIEIRSLFDSEPEEVEGDSPREMFTDNEERVKSYQKWLGVRAEWVEKQKITERTRNLFADLYRYYFELQRESEIEEIIVANGVLCDAQQPEIRHPVLTHRVKMEYDADSNTVSIVDTDTPSELYSTVLQVMEDINLSGISALSEDLQKNDYHPLDRNDTPGFLKILVHQLSSNSLFSEQPISNGEKTHSRLLLYLNPCFIVRKRLDGTLKAIERIIENVQETGDVPKPIRDIVSGGTIDIPEDTGEAPIEERLAAVGGESIDILLSKEANKEQLDIAKRIEHYNAVLVQGPPGTGKTHTIANLMGHFLAQGKAFWDVLNQHGMSCAVILPMNIKEGWQINGLMITRPYEGKIRVYPAEKEKLYNPRFDILGTEGKFTSEKDLPALRDEFFAKVNEEIRLTRMAIENEDVDVLFSYFSTTDGIQHDFWRHCDPKHPEYPGPNEHDNVIRDMYITMDEYVGEVIEKQPDTPLLIMSDHGHGARPVYTVRINELLRRGGFLTPKGGGDGSKPSTKKKIKKTIKKAAIGIVKGIGLPKWAMKLAKKFPVWKSLFASGGDFDWDKTQAYLSDLSALKNYSYGGIRLNETVADKDALADQIIEYLKPIKIEGEDKNLFEWIVRTNTFYHGPYLNKYPEIIYQMDERWGGEWELGQKVFEKGGFMYMMSPGGHRWRTAILFANNIELKKQSYEMTDIYGIIMDALGIEE